MRSAKSPNYPLMTDRQALAFAIFAVGLAARRWPKDRDWQRAQQHLREMLAAERKEETRPIDNPAKTVV